MTSAKEQIQSTKKHIVCLPVGPKSGFLLISTLSQKIGKPAVVEACNLDKSTSTFCLQAAAVAAVANAQERLKSKVISTSEDEGQLIGVSDFFTQKWQ